MKFKISGLAFLLGLGLVDVVFAHPVIFKDGIALQTQNSHRRNDVSLSYSFHPRISVGYQGLFMSNLRQNLLKTNFRAARWNGEDYQGNIYVGLGLGERSGLLANEGLNEKVNLIDAQADWEDRRLYTMAKYSYYQVGDEQESESMVRFGFAPFLADFEDLNIWFIAELEETDAGTLPNSKVTRGLNQYLRFFYKNVLWEIGAGFDRSMKLNIMIHM